MLTRRHFIKLSAGAATASMVGFPLIAKGAKKQVVVIGGGAGGATVAKYIAMADTSIEVTLIEMNKEYYTCFMSNEVLGGDRQIDSIKFGYDGLAKHGVKVVHSKVTGINPSTKKITTESGELIYDSLIVSPGVEMKWGTIKGYDESVIEQIPHAWKAGPQTLLLKKQLEAMKDGGVVIITSPPNPYRCPPGPYERASQIAHYLKQHKPKSKVIILDAKDNFSKQPLFTQAWKELYGFETDKSLIEWVPLSKEGNVVRVDAKKMAVYAGELEDEHKADVINIIPPQTAGKIAIDAELTDDSGWCPVDKKTFSSKKHKDIYVIGDACDATKMPKSGYSANSQAKVCAMAVVAALQGKEIGTPSYVNTCYSLVAPEYGISVADVYRLEGEVITPVKGAGGVSSQDASVTYRKREAVYAHSWFTNITQDMFG